LERVYLNADASQPGGRSGGIGARFSRERETRFTLGAERESCFTLGERCAAYLGAKR
jgi:hypothetical protein